MSEQTGEKEQARLTAFMAAMRDLVAQHEIAGVFIVAGVGVVDGADFGVITDATLGFNSALNMKLRHNLLEILSQSGREVLEVEHERIVAADPSACSEVAAENACRPEMLH